MSIKNKAIIAFLSLFVAFGSLNGASFNCKKAGTFIEHTICNDDKLSKLDEDLAKAYKSAKKKTDKNALKKEQRKWLKTKRKSCQDVKCLRRVYAERVDELNAYGSKQETLQECIDRDFSTQGMLNCSYNDTKRQTKRMNKFYNALLPHLSSYKKKELKIAQESWVNFREAHCTFSDDSDKQGTMYRLSRPGCLNSMTKGRADYFQNKVKYIDSI